MDIVARKLKLGVIGLSPGNGHPYSWSAIFNGYDPSIMKESNFPTILEYLSKQEYPKDFLSEHGEVNAIWTQDPTLSAHIASATRISQICDDIEDLMHSCDGILLARDDAENHKEMARPFLERGIPIFIDKPLATSRSDAEEMISLQKYESQIFTCSALRFAKELQLSKDEKDEIGEIAFIEAFCPKYWETYGVHLIEPIVANNLDRGKLVRVSKESVYPWHVVLVEWEHLRARFHLTKTDPHAIEFVIHGIDNKIKKTFFDSFYCFRQSLLAFVMQTKTKTQLISREETLEVIEIIDNGK